jgi:hypothetical protein
MSARTWFLECRYSDGSTVAVLVPVARDEPFPATLERAERICREINASTIQLFNLDPWGWPRSRRSVRKCLRRTETYGRWTFH